MKKLKEISEIVTVKRLKKFEIFNENDLYDEKSKLSELYGGISRFNSDKEAAWELYKTSPLNPKYRQLKYRFKKRLLNTLFFLNTEKPAFSEFHSAYYECNKNWALIRILLSNGARNTANEILLKTLFKAKKFKLTDIIYLCSKDLQNHYSLVGDEKKFTEYAELTRETEKLLRAENLSNEIYQSIIINFTSSIERKPEIITHVRNSVKKLKQLVNKHKGRSYILDYNMYSVWALSHEVEGDFKKALKVYQKLESYFYLNKEFYQKIRIAEMALKKMVCYLSLKDYKNGKINADRCLHLFRKGSNSWLVFYEYYFLLAMHTGNWVQAADIYNDAVNNNKFGYLSAEQKEKWKIFEAYLYYVLKSGNISTRSKVENKKFKIYKFLNEVPIYSKDKKGYNISILIVQILNLLESQDFDFIITASDALRIYCNRYLAKEEFYFRSNCFIRMLLVMEKESFDYQRTKDAAQEFYLKLKGRAAKSQRRVLDMEVIPYEMLWERILASLKKLDPVEV